MVVVKKRFSHQLTNTDRGKHAAKVCCPVLLQVGDKNISHLISVVELAFLSKIHSARRYYVYRNDYS